jgi:hypothetical protein
MLTCARPEGSASLGALVEDARQAASPKRRSRGASSFIDGFEV